MGTRWLNLAATLLVFHILCSAVVADLAGQQPGLAEFDYPQTYPYGVNNDYNKRLSNFVRIGRGLSSFIRIGKSNPGNGVLPGYEDYVGGANEPGLTDDGGADMYGLGLDAADQPQKRLSSFVRIGRNMPMGDGGEFDTVSKRGSAFMRMGKFPTAYLRNRGRMNNMVSQPYYRRTGRIGHSFIRIGKRDTTEALRKQLAASEAKLIDGDSEDEMNVSSEKEADIGDLMHEYLRLKELVGEDDGELADDVPKDKRKSSFVRIGRMGPLDGLPELEQHFKSTDMDASDAMKRKSSFVRIGKAHQDKRRQSSFVRIGKAMEGYPEKRRQSSFVRIGKANENFPEKRRQSSFVRIGKANENPLEKRRQSSFVRIGKSNEDHPEKRRQSSFVRIGKSPELLEKRRQSSFVRIGKSNENYPEKRRQSSFVRIGKALEAFPEKRRYSSFVRIGKNIVPAGLVDEFNKRMSSFVRIGKAVTTDDGDDFEKRKSSFVRIGKSNLEGFPKRRQSSFVRIGKDSLGDNTLADDVDKRKSSFVRIGKSNGDMLYTGNPDLDKRRMSSFVRIGKSNDIPFDEDDVDNAKRAHSFVRIGKSADDGVDSDMDKRKSSFVRIGKNIDIPVHSFEGSLLHEDVEQFPDPESENGKDILSKLGIDEFSGKVDTNKDTDSLFEKHR